MKYVHVNLNEGEDKNYNAIEKFYKDQGINITQKNIIILSLKIMREKIEKNQR